MARGRRAEKDAAKAEKMKLRPAAMGTRAVSPRRLSTPHPARTPAPHSNRCRHRANQMGSQGSALEGSPAPSPTTTRLGADCGETQTRQGEQTGKETAPEHVDA